MSKVDEVKEILAVNVTEAWYADKADKVAHQIDKLYQPDDDPDWAGARHYPELSDPQPDELISDEEIDNNWPSETPQYDTVEETLKRGILIGARAVANAEDALSLLIEEIKKCKMMKDELKVAYYNAWNQEHEYQHEKVDDEKAHFAGLKAVTQALTDKIIDRLEE